MLTIGELAELAGMKPATLREWERRHGFPEPQRLPSGHRRYPSTTVGDVRDVLERQRAGLSLGAAIGAVHEGRSAAIDTSLFAVAAESPGREPVRLTRRAMLAFSRAIEDACAASGTSGVIVGSFQRESVYRACESRWAELARGARVCVAFADFADVGGDGALVEVPVPPGSPLRREWTVAVIGPRLAACLAGWEWPDSDRFEASWSVDAGVVVPLVERAMNVARATAPDRFASLPDFTRLGHTVETDIGAAMRVFDRVVARLDR